MLDSRDRNLAVGFSCGVFACVLWGLVYLVPLALPDYDPIYITAGRFVSFGLVAVPLIWLERHELACYSASDACQLHSVRRGAACRHVHGRDSGFRGCYRQLA